MISSNPRTFIHSLITLVVEERQKRGEPTWTGKSNLFPPSDYREYPILRTSFNIKLFFIVVEVALCIAFGACSRAKKHNAAAIIEWIIAVVFSFYIFSFTVDLWPAMHTKQVVMTEGMRTRHGTRVKMFGWMRREQGPGGPMEMEEASIAQPERARTSGPWF